jgi:hypothetical protein
MRALVSNVMNNRVSIKCWLNLQYQSDRQLLKKKAHFLDVSSRYVEEVRDEKYLVANFDI